MSPGEVISLILLLVTIQTGALIPMMIYILHALRLVEHRLAKLEGSVKCLKRP